ncbi:hypothetical protein L2E82_32610 [Cichorium intybus]|uniref:Uncharacterized protein n=1 Tax=Cichorium intybus TaxID=13427 RepID=A0ACB9BGW9_CICIN|nr:hypothetical protein L2E82_32610 [Cichorium intybus]
MGGSCIRCLGPDFRRQRLRLAFYSYTLKLVPGLSQTQLTILGIANDLGGNVCILPGIVKFVIRKRTSDSLAADHNMDLASDHEFANENPQFDILPFSHGYTNADTCYWIDSHVDGYSHGHGHGQLNPFVSWRPDITEGLKRLQGRLLTFVGENSWRHRHKLSLFFRLVCTYTYEI